MPVSGCPLPPPACLPPGLLHSSQPRRPAAPSLHVPGPLPIIAACSSTALRRDRHRCVLQLCACLACHTELASTAIGRTNSAPFTGPSPIQVRSSQRQYFVKPTGTPSSKHPYPHPKQQAGPAARGPYRAGVRSAHATRLISCCRCHLLPFCRCRRHQYPCPRRRRPQPPVPPGRPQPRTGS